MASKSHLLALSVVLGAAMLPYGASRHVQAEVALPATAPALDPDAILNNLGLNPELKKKALPSHPGPWQTLVDQPYFKDVPEMKAARLLFHGQYEQAEILCNDLLKKTDLPADKRQAIVETRIEAIFRQGGQANIARFEALAAPLNTPHIQKLKAEAMLATGRQAEATAMLKSFVDSHKIPPDETNALAMFNMYGQLLELKAQYGDALDVYAKVAEKAAHEMPEDPAYRTEVTKAVLRRGIISDSKGEGTSKRARQSAQAEFTAVLNLDATYWPAQLELTRLYFDAHNVKDAMASANLVLGLSPYNVDARLMVVDELIAQYEFEKAAALLEEVKAIDETPLAQAYQGRLLLKERLPVEAAVPLEKALARDPNLLPARGWLAATYFLQNKPDKAEAQLNAVRTADRLPHPIALFQASEVLQDARQYPEAEKLLKEASDQAAWWGEPYMSLAQLYLALGNLDQAQIAYDKGFSIDASNSKTVNQLRLLQLLKTRETIETPHFTIRYQGAPKPDPDHPDAPLPELVSDKVLAQLAAIWCEKIYDDVTGDFQFKPAAKTTIELYPAHEEFAVRITGMSQIGTVGASTGNVIAIDAPRIGKDLNGNFDWARVIRHEFTHTVTLGLTENRIPHWLTEAAAVNEEQAPRDWDWCQLLASNYRAGTLFKFTELSFGFIRPKKPTDRQLAYAESEWVYSYLLATYGHDKMLAFLHAFRDGLNEQDAYKAAFGKSQDTVNADFLKWAGEQIAAWGLPNSPLPKLADAKAAVAKDPTNLDAQKILVQALLAANQIPDAEKAIRAILDKSPDDAEAREKLAAVLIANKKPAEAKPILEKLAVDAPDRPVVARMLGQQAIEAKDYDAAAKWFEKLEQLRPQDDTAYRSLAGIYLGRKDNKAAIDQLEKLAAHEQKDERIPRRLAELFLDAKQYPEAQDYAYRSIRIDPYNALNHQLMAKILVAAGQFKEAAAYWGYAVELEPGTAEFWVGLADANGAAGDKTAAAAAAQKAVAIDPKSAAKKWLP